MAHPGCGGGQLVGGRCLATHARALPLLPLAWEQQQGVDRSSGDRQTPSSQDPARKGIFAG